MKKNLLLSILVLGASQATLAKHMEDSSGMVVISADMSNDCQIIIQKLENTMQKLSTNMKADITKDLESIKSMLSNKIEAKKGQLSKLKQAHRTVTSAHKAADMKRTEKRTQQIKDKLTNAKNKLAEVSSSMNSKAKKKSSY